MYMLSPRATSKKISLIRKKMNYYTKAYSYNASPGQPPIHHDT